MTAALAQTLWLAGLAGLIVLWARAAGRARAGTVTPIGRGEALGALALVAVLAAGAAPAWGGLVAEEGLARVRAELTSPSTNGPARARLFLRHVQLFWAAGTPLRASVGYSPTAALQLPRDYGLDEGAASQDVFTLEDAGPRAARVEINVTPASTTRVLDVVLPGGAEEPGPARRLLIENGRCRRASTAPAAPPAGDPQTTWVVLCTGDEPRALLAFERDLGRRDAAAADTPVRVTPWVWRGGAFRPHHVHLEPGTLLQIGASADALPGVTLWQIPAPAGRPGLLFPPENLLAPCTRWLEGNAVEGGQGGFFAPALGVLEPAAPAHAGSFACVLPFTPPFALEVRRLLPDTAGIWLRSLWAALLLGGPALVLLVAFAAARTSSRSPSAFARVLAVAFTSAVLVALLVVRLLLAHRLDMMRDYEPVGARVAANEAFTALLGAALAGAAAAVGLAPARRPVVRALTAAVAWALTLALAVSAIVVNASAAQALTLQALVSLALATAPAWWGPAVRALPRPPKAGGELLPLLGGLVLVGLVAAAGRTFTPHAVPPKLFATWAFVPLAYLALRASLGRPPAAVAAVAALLAIDFALLLRLDTGVTVAIGGAGLLLALAAAANDALYTDADSRLLDAFARQVRPLVSGQALVLVGLAVVLAGWALLGLAAGGPEDPRLPQTVTHAALHALALAAALFLGAAALLRRLAPRRAAAWLAVAVLLIAAWAARGVAVDRVLAGKSEASSRVAAILDPAYALLADERAFAKGLTAWRETAAPGATLASGQGYFGAQVLDPGVLLSIDNDYLPVLLLRELGAGGLARLVALALGAALALWLVGAGRFPGGSAAARARRVLAALVGVVTIYQLVGALGVLPFTGIAWPGLGIDSPSDLWVYVALLVFIALLGEPPAERARVPLLTRRLVVGAAAAVALAGCLVAARIGAFALRRREPVEPTASAARLTAPFEGLEAVFDYVYRMQCPLPAPPDVVAPLLGEPDTPALRRFQKAYLAAWAAEEAGARAELARYRGGDKNACNGTVGHWRYERKAGACHMTFKAGWPAVAFAFGAGAAGKSSCDIEVADDVLRAFRYPLRRPYADARVRLVARAVGDAARDRGELVSGQVVVRLRPGSGTVDVSAARAGVYAAEKVILGADVEVALTDGIPTARRPAQGKSQAKLLVAQAPRVHLLEPSARWETLVLDPAGAPTPLKSLSVIVDAAGTGRNVWLFRPPSLHPGDVTATVDPLLADDVVSVLGSRRRQYVYGGLVPELGWVSPALADRSLGLDGWVHAAVARVGPGAKPPPAPSCGTLAPPAAAEGFARVCAPSPVDQVLECRVALQPELETRLGHLLELTAERPELFTPPKLKGRFFPATSASFALLRGDTGEIIAQGHFVPGRESTAYAPATPSLEKYLIAARDDRDPVTGAPAPHQESGAEKADWPQPIAVGSTMKPLFARALERAAPDATKSLVLTAAGKRSGCEPILGHCPPTKTLWNHTETAVDLSFFLSASVNWFQAAIGLLGTSLPDGERGEGGGPAVAMPTAVEKPDEAHRLWTRWHGRDVIRADGTIDENALRTTPMWRELEALVGRPLCTGGKEACTRAADRRDLCAARALPLAAPSSDLRHLVAIGPSGFDFSDGGPPRERQLVKEYLQFLRGSGKHPLASTLQLADAFNRVFYDAGAAPYKLAASWFPVAPTGSPPPVCSRATAEGRTVQAGLCRALVDGTAAHLAPRLGEAKIVFYGAKTGTVDSLGDIVEKKNACEAWNRAHTLAGASSQPYHLDCTDPARNELNDSLFVVGFGVKLDGGGTVPFTLALRYQRVGTVPPYGYAVYAVEEFLDLIADYFS